MTQLTLEQAFELAMSHHRAGRLNDAMNLYQQILQVVPDHPDSLHLMGVILSDIGRPDQAEGLIRRSLSLNPDNSIAVGNLGLALQRLFRLDEAIECFNHAIGMSPDIPEHYNSLGCVYRLKGMNRQAIEAFQNAIRLRENYFEAHNNLGAAFHELWMLDNAVAAYQRAIEFAPAHPAPHNNLGNAYKDQGRLKEAIQSFKNAIQCNPHFPDPHGNLILAMQYDPDCDDLDILRETRVWSDRFAKPRFERIKPHDNDPNPDRKLRIGFVSRDFKLHPVGRLIAPLLERLNPSFFETFCYFDHPIPDRFTHFCRQLSKNWANIHPLPDEAAADLIRKDRIDILVDLASHTGHNRLLLFAEKPAPVQATWLAYCGTTGLSTIDYRISDPLLDPPDFDPSRYSEKTQYISSYWCYPAHGGMSQPGEPPCLKNGFITFGCLNNFCKISPKTTLAWRDILSKVPGARLILFGHEGAGRDIFRRALAVDELSRVDFVNHRGFLEYMELYHNIDIALDPFPFNGGTTTCDALWMGVPVVSLVGARAVSRAGLSVLTQVGMPQYAVNTLDEYVRLAVNLAGDIPELSNIRSTLRDQMLHSPLMDADRFARDMENAFRTMWRRYCAR